MPIYHWRDLLKRLEAVLELELTRADRIRLCKRHRKLRSRCRCS